VTSRPAFSNTMALDLRAKPAATVVLRCSANNALNTAVPGTIFNAVFRPRRAGCSSIAHTP